jgi:tRNA 2-selenouridine synthase
MLEALDKRPALGVGEFISRANSAVVFDVRTPSEFAQGHIPGAINLPLFTDDERVEIGTLYKQTSKDASIRRGLEFVGPKMRHYVDEVSRLSEGKPVLVHCWRGGMRSGAMAWLLNFSGIKTETLEGGYKTFRHWVLSVFDRPYDLRVVGGLTGSGKTDILKILAERGEQVLDLEGLAHHRGSAFGGLGMAPQPTNEQFENEIASALNSFDITQPVWIEDESRLVGRLQTPKALFENKEESPIYVIDRSKHERALRLVVDYGSFPKEQLASRIEKIRDQLGGERAQLALEALETGDLVTVASFMLDHYDKKYLAALHRKAANVKHIAGADGLTPPELAAKLITLRDEEPDDESGELES